MTTARRIHDLIDDKAECFPDRIALRNAEGRSVSWSGYRDEILKLAGWLTRQGVRQSDRVMLVAENALVAAIAIFACSRIGAIVSPVNARMTSPELERIAAHAEPVMILYTAAASASASVHATSAGATFVLALPWLVALRQKPCSDVRGTTFPMSRHCSYSTGAPKGVILTHGNLLYAAKVSSEMRGMTAGDLLYGVLPLTNIFGLASMLCEAARSGAAILLAARFSPQALFEALRRDVTIYQGVPQMHAQLMTHANAAGHATLDSPSLRYVSSGGAPLDPGWKHKAKAFYRLPVQNGWGMTECTAGACATRNPIGSNNVSVGRAFDGAELAVRPSDGRDPKVGELLTRGPHVMNGYFRNPEATAAAIDPQGWLHSGDLARLDEDGNVFIVGRLKELIIRGGFNVYPPEVEAVLNSHPAVLQSAVMGWQTDRDEDVVAFVQCRPGRAVAPEALIAFAASQLIAYKLPLVIHLVESLPAGPSGKILKHTLREAYAAVRSAT